ncbi:GntR family transcriptional regulator [Aquabacterium sp.]|uniref:GntR family transcriptional regulator n=1 Tax=Aquabacterium sp. TaxID=1872578 RepID=UPI003783F20B
MSKPRTPSAQVVPLHDTAAPRPTRPAPLAQTDLAAALAAQSAQSPAPLYAQIKQLLRERILDGSYQPHQQMPSEAEMMASFGVSRITVRQALADLQNEGLIFRLHGKGTFVSKPKAFQDLGRLQGFGEAMREHGYESFNRVLSMQSVQPPAAVAERLRLPRRGKATELRRLRFLNREPISLDLSYLPPALGQRLGRKDLATRDIFAILENDFGLALGHADLQIGSALADETLAGLLRVEEGAPVLQIERTTHLADGTPIDHELLYYRGDAFQYKVRVDRVAAPASTPSAEKA